MASARLQGDSERTAAAPHVLPQPQQLAALGTVLCLHRLQHGSELTGWAHAAYAEAAVGVDSDGLRESVHFFDRDGRCCWRLHLLPDSDFLGWDRMMTSLPCAQEATERERGVAERLWQRLAGRVRGGQWRACTVRLYALAQPGATPPVLAASLAAVSPLGAATARRIIQAEGLEADIALECTGDEAALLTTRTTQETYGIDSEQFVFEVDRINSPTLALPRKCEGGKKEGTQLIECHIHKGGNNVVPLIKLRKQP